MDNKFPSDAYADLGHYVYRLVDPRNGQTFYVGEGCENRVYAHVEAASKSTKEFYAEFGTDIEKNILENLENEDEFKDDINKYDYAKLSRIKEIQNEGLEVIHIIQRYGLTKETAHELEAALIDLYGLDMLTNKISGWHNERGMFYTEKLRQILTAKEYEDDKYKPYMIIKVKESSVNDAIGIDKRYEATRKWWKVNYNNAMECKYVLSVTDLVVKAVYENPQWDENENTDGRRSFVASECKDEEVRRHFINKKIPKEKYSKQGQSNPCLYSK